MVAVVLTGSTGFGLVEHTCHFSKKTTVSVGIADRPLSCCRVEAGCPAAPHEHFRKAPCCTETTHYENVDVSASLTGSAAKVGKLAVEALTEAVVYTAMVLVQAVLAFITDSPHEQAAVPLSGRSLLAFVQSFLL